MYDAAIIGGGPGGYAAAIRVSQLGGKAVLIENDAVGGTCVNRGCIPTKVWHRAACILKNLTGADEFGIRAFFKGLDLAGLKARKDGVASEIRTGMESLLQNNGVDVIRSFGTLKGPNEISAGEKTVEARKIIVASGSRPEYPEIAGLEDAVLTTNLALDLTEVPSRLLVLGGGPVETEMAVFFCLFGARVCLATPEPRVLPDEDHDVSQRIGQGLRELGVEIFTRHDLVRVDCAGPAYEAVLSGPREKTVTVDRVLTARRRPNTRGMGLIRTGVKLAEDGAVPVNDRLETAIPGVYAIGDCVGGRMFSHRASAMAVTAAENAMGLKKRFPFHLVPRAIWTIPEAAAVGMTEEEAEKAGHDVETGAFPFAVNGLAMARGEVDGEVKVVFDPKYGEILGVHIVGANATELIGEAVLAMRLECTVKELADGIRAHPTFSEAVVDAARDALDWALYLPRR